MFFNLTAVLKKKHCCVNMVVHSVFLLLTATCVSTMWRENFVLWKDGNMNMPQCCAYLVYCLGSWLILTQFVLKNC